MEDNLNKIIESLRRSKPTLKDPEILTDRIMDRIEQQAGHKTAPMLIWIRAALSAAAVLLFGLFLLQQTDSPQSLRTENVPKAVAETPADMDSACLQQLGSEHLNYLKTYLCYLQQNAIENELFKTYPQQKN